MLYISKKAVIPIIVTAESNNEEHLHQAYIDFSEQLYEMNISTSICVEDFINGYTWNSEDMIEEYVEELIEKEIDRAARVYYVTSATSTQKNDAVQFCELQIGKKYGIGMPLITSCEYSTTTIDWYCTELVWAAYYRQGININGTAIPINIFMPETFALSTRLTRRSVL